MFSYFTINFKGKSFIIISSYATQSMGETNSLMRPTIFVFLMKLCVLFVSVICLSFKIIK